MTMPHLMNCDHSEDGWCLDCVKKLHDDSVAIRDAAMRLLVELKRSGYISNNEDAIFLAEREFQKALGVTIEEMRETT